MRARRTIRKRQRETGIALLIAIFILLLIGVVAIALIVSSGTESALAGNYRSSTGVYYAAVAGLEEARARLRSNNPNSFSNTAPGFLPPSGTPLAVCSPIYVINPVGGETVAPWDPANAYYDSEFNNEFVGVPNCTLPSPSPSTLSVWNKSPLNGLPFPGPFYKWVRINGVSEQSLNLDTSPHDGTIDPRLVYYDGTNLNDTNGGNQVLEITALAVLLNGSQKLLQYVVAPQPLDLNFPAALILDGNTPQFTAPTSPSFWVRGYDQGSVGSCNPGSTALPAVGYTSGFISNFVRPSNPSGIPAGPSPSPDLRDHYTNGIASNPDIVQVTLSPNLQTVAGLNSLVQTITQNADAVINGPVTQSNSTNIMPSGMSATNPMTVVVNGDLTFSGWHNTGYGLLLVTGKLTYDPEASWDGIILVIGKGWMYSYQGNGTTTQIQGAALLAKTVDASNNPLPASSAAISPRFDFNSTPNSLTNSINYSSCWVQAAMPAMPYKILSFHEIAQ